MAYLLHTDECVEEVMPANGDYFTLEELNRFVGGHIEVVRSIAPSYILVINEECKIKELPYNAVATGLAVIAYDDYIAGPALFCLFRDLQEPDERLGIG